MGCSYALTAYRAFLKSSNNNNNNEFKVTNFKQKLATNKASLDIRVEELLTFIFQDNSRTKIIKLIQNYLVTQDFRTYGFFGFDIVSSPYMYLQTKDELIFTKKTRC